jgi:hypothetical protein
MRFLDPAGAAMTVGAWREAFRDPSYGEPLRCQGDGFYVDCSWVGVAADGEDPPRIWLVRALRSRTNGGLDINVREPAWFAAREEAAAHYEKLKDDLSWGGFA